MSVVKVKFKDGSTADIDESLLDKAREKGAVPVSDAEVSGNVKVRFKDGSEATIKPELKDKALQAGAVVLGEDTPKKKDDSEAQSTTNNKGFWASQAISNDAAKYNNNDAPSVTNRIHNNPRGFLENDIEHQHMLSDPRYADHGGLLSDYKQRKENFEAEVGAKKAEIFSSPETLAAYTQKRFNDIDQERDRKALEQSVAMPATGLSGPETPDYLGKAMQAKMNEPINLEADTKKEQIKNAVADVVTPMVLSKYSDKPVDSWDFSEIGKQIMTTADPRQKKLHDDAVTMSDYDRSNMELYGINATKAFLAGLGADQYDAEKGIGDPQLNALYGDVKKAEESFQKNHPERTQMMAEEKIGAYFYKQNQKDWQEKRKKYGGVEDPVIGYVPGGGFWGTPTEDLIIAARDPESGLTDEERKMVTDVIIPTEKRLFFSTNIPGSGFFRSTKNAIEQSIVSMGKTVADKFGLRTDMDVAQNVLNQDVEDIRFRPPGENPDALANLAYLKMKEKIGPLSAEEQGKKKELEQYTDIRSGFSRFVDGTGNLTGQIIPIALVTRGLGTVGGAMEAIAAEGGITGFSGGLTTAAAGKILSNETVGLFMSSYLNAYDNYKMQAEEMMPGKENAGARNAYSNVMSAVEGLTEMIFPDTKVLGGFLKNGVSPSVADIAKKFVSKEITQIAARDEMASVLKKNFKQFGKEFFESTFKESFEEGVNDVAQGIADSIFLGQPFDIAKTGKQALNTFLTTAMNSGVVSTMAGVGHVRQNKSEMAFMKATMMDMGRRPAQYKSAVNDLLNNGDITQQDANEKIRLINTSNKILREMPQQFIVTKKTDGGTFAEMRSLDYPDATSYLLHRMNESILQEQADNTSDEVLKKQLEAEVKRSQDIRKGILDRVISTTPGLQAITYDPSLADKLRVTPAQQVSQEDRDFTPLVNPDPEPEKAKTGATEIKNTDEVNAIQPQEQSLVDAEQQDKPVNEITVGEMIDKPGTYQGKRGTFVQDGQTVVFKVDGSNREYELGNVDEIKDSPIADYGIEHEESVVSRNDNGNFVVRGEEFVNNYSDPTQAISRTKDGGYSVSLETKDGKKRTFRGNVGEDLAYHIQLQSITANNETEQFEQFVNESESAKAAIQDAGHTEAAPEAAAQSDADVSRQQIKPKDAEVRAVESQAEIDKQEAQQNIDAQASEKLKNVTKPNIKLNFISDKQLASVAQNRAKNIQDHELIKAEHQELEDLINCIYG